MTESDPPAAADTANATPVDVAAATTDNTAAFIAGLPKVELHVHHVGSASPRIVAELAARHEGSTPVPADESLLAEYFRFTGFAHFISTYLSVVDLIRDPTDVWTLTYEIGRELAAQNVRYAELTLTPYTTVLRGIPAEAFCEAVEDARRRALADHEVALAWCMDIPGEEGIPGADATLDIATGVRPDGLVSFGLGGPELGVPREQFAPHFRAAIAEGLHSVPHAGESAGPESVWDAINHLGAERIGHGIAAVHDPRLLEFLRDNRIALEICPTSNVCTRSVPSIEQHPLPQLVAAGVPVTINSDDPPMFATTLNAEYAVATGLLGLGRPEITELARTAVQASFLDDPGKTRLLGEIDAYASAYEAGLDPAPNGTGPAAGG